MDEQSGQQQAQPRGQQRRPALPPRPVHPFRGCVSTVRMVIWMGLGRTTNLSAAAYYRQTVRGP